MTPRDLRNIHTTGSSCRDALPCMNMALKLPRYFYLLMVATSKFGLFNIRWHSATRKHLFPYPHGDRSGLGKPKKRISITLITATTSVHLPKPVSTDLTIKPDSVLTNPIGKDGVQSWSMENIYPIRHFYRDTITRRVANQG